MKKRIWSVILTLALLLVPLQAMAALQDFQATVYRWTGNYNQDGSPGLTKLTSGVTFTVLAVGSNTAETLYVYNDRRLTSLPTTASWVTAATFASNTYCAKEVRFKTDPTDSTNDKAVDLIVTDLATGATTFVEDFDKFQHTIVIDARPNVEHHGIVPFQANVTSQKNTGVTFGLYANIKRVLLEIINTSPNTSTSGAINVGDPTTATGFINAEKLGTAGFINTSIASTGSSLASIASGIGSVLKTNGHITTSTASVLWYTANTTEGAVGATSTNPSGYIHYWFTRMR